MKVDINTLLQDSQNPESKNVFDVSFGEFCGVPAYLIQPDDIKTKFNKDNTHLRSCVIDTDGNIISVMLYKIYSILTTLRVNSIDAKNKMRYLSEINISIIYKQT